MGTIDLDLEIVIYILKQVEHELITTNNLYVADFSNFEEKFQIDFTNVIENVEKLIAFICENKPIENIKRDVVEYKRIS